MSGIYLFWDNPVLAYGWALRKQKRLEPLPAKLQAASKTKEKPIVLKVNLKDVKAVRILNLTTDKGMEILYKGHRFFKGLIEDKLGESLKAMRRHHSTMASIYYIDLGKKYIREQLCSYGLNDSQIEGILTHFCKKFGIAKLQEIEYILANLIASVSERGFAETFNFDCVVLTLLVLKYKFAIVIFAVQEGQTLNEEIHDHLFQSPFTDGYEGIRSQDHLELCVTNPKVIQWPPQKYRFNPNDYDEEYLRSATIFRGVSKKKR
jgi:hypothetical protein